MLALRSGKPRFTVDHFPDDVQEYPSDILTDIGDALDSGRLSLFSSKAVRTFEDRIAAYVGVRHCVAVANGTLALVAALRAAGLTHAEKVIVPGYSYAATRTAVEACGCDPVYVDIDPDTWCIDPRKIPEEALRTATAIIPVHLFGCPCTMDDVMHLAQKYGLVVIEDCAQSMGAEWGKQRVGSFGIGCYSFMQNKLVRAGEGGAVTTNDPVLAETVRRLRHEGEVWSRFSVSTSEPCDIVAADLIGGVEYPVFGMNLRMSALGGIIGCYSLDRLEDEMSTRERNAATLSSILEDVNGLVVQKCPRQGGRVWWSYVCEVRSEHFGRDALIGACAAEGIPVGVHFPIPLCCTRGRELEKGRLPRTLHFCGRQIAFPTYASLAKEHILEMGEAIGNVAEELRDAGPEVVLHAERYLHSARVSRMIGGTYFVTAPIAEADTMRGRCDEREVY